MRLPIARGRSRKITSYDHDGDQNRHAICIARRNAHKRDVIFNQPWSFFFGGTIKNAEDAQPSITSGDILRCLLNEQRCVFKSDELVLLVLELQTNAVKGKIGYAASL